MKEKIFYLCDSRKNKECKKSVCQEICTNTLNKNYAKLDCDKKPMVVYKIGGNKNGGQNGES